MMGMAAASLLKHGFSNQDKQKAALATVKIAEYQGLDKAGGFVLMKNTPQGDILIVNSGDGQFAAMSNVCPHRKCRVEVKNPTLIQCPCHGSTYKIDGTHVSGPANKSLKKFRARAEAGIITVSKD
jgi:Rieske Fe-S protein